MRPKILFSIVALIVASCSAAADIKTAGVLDALRAEDGLPRLSQNDDLQRAAFAHAEDMLRNSYFSHTGSDGSTVADRVSRTGYQWCYVAENIAQGQKDLTEVMKAWVRSPGHRSNLLSESVREFGLAEGPGYIWVIVLAARTC